MSALNEVRSEAFSLRNSVGAANFCYRNSKGNFRFSGPSKLQQNFDDKVAQVFKTFQTTMSQTQNQINFQGINNPHLASPYIHDIEVINKSGIKVIWHDEDGNELRVQLENSAVGNGIHIHKLKVNDATLFDGNTVVHRELFEKTKELFNKLNSLLNTLNEIINFNETSNEAQTKLDALNTRSTSEANVIDHVIPDISDKLAIFRNFVGFISALIALVSLTTPIGWIAIAALIAGIALVHVGTAIYLCKKYPENIKQILLGVSLSFVLSASSIIFASNMGQIGEVVLKGFFGALVVIQGGYFIQQGWSGWVNQGARWHKIGVETQDSDLKATSNRKIISGGLSAVEGGAWIALGLIKLTLALLLMGVFGVPDPTLVDKLGYWIDLLTTVLFDMIFTVSYAFMIYSGYMDMKRHQVFEQKMKELLGDEIAGLSSSEKANRYLKALEYIKTKLTDTSAEASRDREHLKKELMRNQNSTKELIDSGDYCLELKNIDILIETLKEEIEKINNGNPYGATLNTIGNFFSGIMDANKRLIELDKLNMKLGVIGLLGGFFINHVFPLIGGGSFDMAPFYHKEIFSGPSELFGVLSSLGDCMLWMAVNYGFWTMDKSFNMSKEEVEHLKEIQALVAQYKAKRKIEEQMRLENFEARKKERMQKEERQRIEQSFMEQLWTSLHVINENIEKEQRKEQRLEEEAALQRISEDESLMQELSVSHIITRAS